MKRIQITILLFAFTSHPGIAQSSDAPHDKLSPELCTRSVKYDFVAGRIFEENQQRIDSFITTVWINPTDKKIIIKTKPPGRDSMTLIMENFEILNCQFSESEGAADYKGNLLMNGETIKTIIHIRSNNGKFSFDFDNKDGSPAHAVLEGYEYKIL